MYFYNGWSKSASHIEATHNELSSLTSPIDWLAMCTYTPPWCLMHQPVPSIVHYHSISIAASTFLFTLSLSVYLLVMLKYSFYYLHMDQSSRFASDISRTYIRRGGLGVFNITATDDLVYEIQIYEPSLHACVIGCMVG